MSETHWFWLMVDYIAPDGNIVLQQRYPNPQDVGTAAIPSKDDRVKIWESEKNQTFDYRVLSRKWSYQVDTRIIVLEIMLGSI